MRKALLAFFLVIFAIGAVYSGYRVYDILREYRAGEDLYSGAQQHILFPAAESIMTAGKEAVPENIPPEAAKPELLFPEVDFAGLLQVSEDVVGWVYIDGTNINYPIVQGEDNRYYVSALMDGTENKAGSIFMDYMNNADFSDMHTILYGHNMKNGTMFHDIVNYQEQEFFEQHPVGLIMTPEKNYYFDVVSAYVASLADPSWQLEFVDDADALQWLQDSIVRSAVACDIQPQPGDKIITLSTCTYEFEDARFILVGILHEA